MTEAMTNAMTEATTEATTERPMATRPEITARTANVSARARRASLAMAICLAAACGGTGMGAATRADISTQMAVAQAPLETCYAQALKGNRKLAGMVVLSFVAAPKTGQFESITITHDELRDPAVRQCIVDEVGKLKLEKPQGSRVSISYPIRFAPKN